MKSFRPTKPAGVALQILGCAPLVVGLFGFVAASASDDLSAAPWASLVVGGLVLMAWGSLALK